MKDNPDRPDTVKLCEVCGHWLSETPSYTYCSNCDTYVSKAAQYGTD